VGADAANYLQPEEAIFHHLEEVTSHLPGIVTQQLAEEAICPQALQGVMHQCLEVVIAIYLETVIEKINTNIDSY